MESWIFRNRSRLLAIYDGIADAARPAAALPAPPAPAAVRPVLAGDATGRPDGLRQLELLPTPRRPAPPGPDGSAEE